MGSPGHKDSSQTPFWTSSLPTRSVIDAQNQENNHQETQLGIPLPMLPFPSSDPSHDLPITAKPAKTLLDLPVEILDEIIYCTLGFTRCECDSIPFQYPIQRRPGKVGSQLFAWSRARFLHVLLTCQLLRDITARQVYSKVDFRFRSHGSLKYFVQTIGERNRSFIRYLRLEMSVGLPDGEIIAWSQPLHKLPRELRKLEIHASTRNPKGGFYLTPKSYKVMFDAIRRFSMLEELSFISDDTLYGFGRAPFVPRIAAVGGGPMFPLLWRLRLIGDFRGHVPAFYISEIISKHSPILKCLDLTFFPANFTVQRNQGPWALKPIGMMNGKNGLRRFSMTPSVSDRTPPLASLFTTLGEVHGSTLQILDLNFTFNSDFDLELDDVWTLLQRLTVLEYLNIGIPLHTFGLPLLSRIVRRRSELPHLEGLDMIVTCDEADLDQELTEGLLSSRGFLSKRARLTFLISQPRNYTGSPEKGIAKFLDRSMLVQDISNNSPFTRMFSGCPFAIEVTIPSLGQERRVPEWLNTRLEFPPGCRLSMITRLTQTSR